MSKITGNEPITATHKYFDEKGESKECLGLTIRQDFAARAMQSLLYKKDSSTSGFEVCHLAVLFADALIEELNKEK